MLLAQTYFWVCAALAVIGALATVIAPNPIRGAMGLLMMILAVAGLFLALHAQFLAAIQVIVYAGAIIVLFLFVIMLLGPSATSPRDARLRNTRILSGLVFAVAAAIALGLVFRGATHAVLPTAPNDFGSIDAFGRILFADDLAPFELSSALLMVSVVGAVAVARGSKQDVGVTKKTGGPLAALSVDARTMGTPIAREHLPGTLDPRGGE